MRSPLRAWTAVATLGVIAFAWVWLRHGEAPIETVLTPAAAPPVEPVQAASADPAPEPPATVKLRELGAMSETYRNTTFLIAIRDSGFTCHELLGVHGGVDDAMAWTAACSDMLAYSVRIATSGALAVEPLATYFDAVGPRIDQQPSPQPGQQLRQLPLTPSDPR
jgi:hypothetical protein